MIMTAKAVLWQRGWISRKVIQFSGREDVIEGVLDKMSLHPTKVGVLYIGVLYPKVFDAITMSCCPETHRLPSARCVP